MLNLSAKADRRMPDGLIGTQDQKAMPSLGRFILLSNPLTKKHCRFFEGVFDLPQSCFSHALLSFVFEHDAHNNISMFAVIRDR